MENNNTRQIELIRDKCIKNRIKNEYKELITIYKDENDICIHNDFETNKVILIINKKYANNVDKYTFIVDRKYPFHPPIFHFNDNPYSHYLKMPSQRFSDHLKQFTNKTCLCCSSLCCKYNWSPAIKLKMFIDELNGIRQCKRKIVYKILCDQIKDKYLIDDVDLDSWID